MAVLTVAPMTARDRANRRSMATPKSAQFLLYARPRIGWGSALVAGVRLASDGDPSAEGRDPLMWRCLRLVNPGRCSGC